MRRDATRPCADPYATPAENSFFYSASKSTQALLLLSREQQLRFRYFLCHFFVPLFVGDAMTVITPPYILCYNQPLFFSLFFHQSENSRISVQNGRFIAFLTTSFLAQFAAQERDNHKACVATCANTPPVRRGRFLTQRRRGEERMLRSKRWRFCRREQSLEREAGFLTKSRFAFSKAPCWQSQAFELKRALFLSAPLRDIKREGRDCAPYPIRENPWKSVV